MSDTREALERSLFELRQAFDAAFAVPAEPSRKAPRGYLGIRLEDTPYALDLDEVAAVRKSVPVTPLPSEESRLLGVAGFDGTLTAVYDLAALLGQTRVGAPVWFVLVRGAPVAFAFQGMDGHLRLEAEEADGAVADDANASDLSWRPGLDRPVIRLGALVARLRGEKSGEPREGAASR